MGAELVQKRDAIQAVAEGDEPLAHELDAHRRAIRARQLLGEERRHPEAPQEIAHQRSRIGPGQTLIVFLRNRHRVLVSLTDPPSVMTGLVPAIHVSEAREKTRGCAGQARA